MRAIAENEPLAELPMTCQIKHIANEATKLAAAAHPRKPETKQTHRWAILVRIGAAFSPIQPTPEPEPDSGQPEAA